ncbi:unnamed protein product [Meloidogyne enterolobii]|uniref:Uncharacterized protein n=1 Tax=Meloidogyne enterolobii TaxID=390850 RepID=A0ACB0YKF4_MELEN
MLKSKRNVPIIAFPLKMAQQQQRNNEQQTNSLTTSEQQQQQINSSSTAATSINTTTTIDALAAMLGGGSIEPALAAQLLGLGPQIFWPVLAILCRLFIKSKVVKFELFCFEFFLFFDPPPPLKNYLKIQRPPFPTPLKIQKLLPLPLFLPCFFGKKQKLQNIKNLFFLNFVFFNLRAFYFSTKYKVHMYLKRLLFFLIFYFQIFSPL